MELAPWRFSNFIVNIYIRIENTKKSSDWINKVMLRMLDVSVC